MSEVVDLYGRAGYDVLCITDHVVRGHTMITDEVFVPYLRAIQTEAARAEAEYGMLVIPGLELTWDDADPVWAAHAVVIGVHRHISLDDGLDAALERANQLGAAIVAVHPHALETDPTPGRTTRRWWIDRDLRGTRAPVRADQPAPGLKLGRAEQAACRGGRRLPRREPPRHVEDGNRRASHDRRGGQLPSLRPAGDDRATRPERPVRVTRCSAAPPRYRRSSARVVARARAGRLRKFRSRAIGPVAPPAAR
jgi:hypothetical protein